MNSQSYFSRVDEHERGDALECTDRIVQAKDICKLIIGSGPNRLEFDGTKLKGTWKIGLGGPLYNIYCMYNHDINGAIRLDRRIRSFGDSFIIVLNTEIFLEKIKMAVVRAGLNCKYRPVNYFDDATYTGDTGVFRKSARFRHQKEFRIAVWPGRSCPIRLRIGNINSLCSPIFSISRLGNFRIRPTRIREI